MRQQVLASLAVSALACSICSAQNQLWITQFGTVDDEWAVPVMPDASGGSFVAGSTSGDLGGPNAGPPFSLDAFVARYDSAGTQLWARQFGTSGEDSAEALAPDATGGMFIAGTTSGRLGGAQLGHDDAWIARYDSDGNQLWIRQFGTSEDDRAYALATDGKGGVMVGGFTGIPGGWVAFVARYDELGNELWFRSFGTGRGDVTNALATDNAGGVYVAGYTEGTLGGASAGGPDPFLARYDSAGTQLWVRQFGTISPWEQATSLAPDGSGGVIVVGYTQGDMAAPNAGKDDAFLARYNGAGNRLWIIQFGSSEKDIVRGLAPDGQGGAVMAGLTTGSLGGLQIGDGDAFLARYDGAGNRVWINQFGSVGGDAAFRLAPDGTGSMIVAGQTNGDMNGPNIGGFDAWIGRFEIDSCYPDCDQSTGNGVLDVFDFLCFQNSFVHSEPYACDCDTSTGNGVCDVFDFLCFQNAFVGGCP